ncbi:putative membrane protein, partial [Escherichia coli P0304799.3]
MLFAAAIKASFSSASILKLILTCAIYHLVITTYI